MSLKQKYTPCSCKLNPNSRKLECKGEAQIRAHGKTNCETE